MALDMRNPWGVAFSSFYRWALWAWRLRARRDKWEDGARHVPATRHSRAGVRLPGNPSDRNELPGNDEPYSPLDRVGRAVRFRRGRLSHIAAVVPKHLPGPLTVGR